MTLELLRVGTAGGEVAFLDYGPRRPRGVTLVAGHGYSSSKHNLDVLCSFLSSHGFRVLSLDFPGHKLGASGGRLDSPHDLTGAMHAVVAHGFAHGGEVLYTLGHSMGATTALRTCAENPAIGGAIAIATGAGRPSALKVLSSGVAVDLRSRYVDGLALPELMEASEPLLAAALPALAGRPVLFVGAKRDAMVSPASARELFEAAPEPKVFETIDSDHTYAGENARATVLAWLNAMHPR